MLQLIASSTNSQRNTRQRGLRAPNSAASTISWASLSRAVLAPSASSAVMPLAPVSAVPGLVMRRGRLRGPPAPVYTKGSRLVAKASAAILGRRLQVVRHLNTLLFIELDRTRMQRNRHAVQRILHLEILLQIRVLHILVKRVQIIVPDRLHGRIDGIFGQVSRYRQHALQGRRLLDVGDIRAGARGEGQFGRA